MDCLVYVDPSQRGEWVLTLAAQLPRDYASRMVLLATAEDEALAPGLLARAGARLAVTGAFSWNDRAPAGPAERAILEESTAHSYGLVIVPPAGRNALARMLKGSRVATVVRSVKASVLVARRPPARIGRMLVAVSGGAASEAVVEAALRLESATGARATFLHVASEVALPFARTSSSSEDNAAAQAAAERGPPTRARTPAAWSRPAGASWWSARAWWSTRSSPRSSRAPTTCWWWEPPRSGSAAGPARTPRSGCCWPARPRLWWSRA